MRPPYRDVAALVKVPMVVPFEAAVQIEPRAALSCGHLRAVPDQYLFGAPDRLRCRSCLNEQNERASRGIPVDQKA